MRSILRTFPTLVLLSASVAAPAARADVIRILSSDARGVTLRVTAEAWSLSAPDASGRSHVVGVPDSHVLADPGHGLVPVYSTLLALPPDAHPSVRVIASGAPISRDNVRLAIAGKPVFRPGEKGAFEPAMQEVPALTDGVWPGSPVHLGAVDSFRGRRLVGLEIRPFQYDEAGRRLVVTPTLDVRVDFGRPSGASLVPGGGAPGGAGSDDPHFDDVLRSSVLNFDQARSWRTRAAAARPASLFAPTGAAPGFDETQPEVRVQIDSTGLYLLPFDLLSANGYPANVPIAQVSVHKHEYLPGVSPPYETLDVPVEVDDVNGNGVFDSGDRIWLYARDWASRSGVSRYQRWWGDGDVVYATVKPTGGARIPQRPGTQGATGLTPLASAPFTAHFEQNFAFFMPIVGVPIDTTIDLFQWTSYVLYYSRPDSIQFGINDPDTSRAVTVTTNWVGRSFDNHNLWAAVKNPQGVQSSAGDSVIWTGKEPFTWTATLDGSALGSGTNKFVTWGKNSPAPPDPSTNAIANVGLDYFEATYYRRFRAAHDLLPFNSDTATGTFQVHVSGFQSDSIRVYDVTVPEQPVRLTLGPGQIAGGGFDLQDVAAGGARRSYVAGAVQAPLAAGYGPRVPPAANVSAVTRRGIWQNVAGDYLLIVPEAFLPAVSPLVTLRSSQGLRVVVATAEGVYDEFNGGRHSPAAIQRFVQYAYANWDSRFLLLFGDGTLDPLNDFKQSRPDWIPILPTPGPVAVSDGYEMVPSDNRYGCLTGNCDPIYGGADVIPEMMIGRLPVNSLAEAQGVVAKLVAYETAPSDPTWRRHSVLLSDDAYSSGLAFGVGNGTSDYCFKDYEQVFEGLNDKVHSIIVRDAGLAQSAVDDFKERTYLLSEPTDTTWAGNIPITICRPDINATRSRCHNAVTPQLFSMLNTGTLWLNFQGHANEYVLTHEDLYRNNGDSPGSDDKFLFTSDPSNIRPLFFTAFSCHANMFARGTEGASGVGGCTGEDIVDLPYGGAIASWASVCYEVVPRDDSTHLNVELARTMFAEPPHDPQLWDNGARVVLGEVIQATYLRFVPTVYSYPYERGVAVTYTLLGDPATRVSTGRPQTLVYANDSLMTDGQPFRLHTPGDTLTMVADLVSTERIDSIGVFENAAGPDAPVPAAQFTVTPAFPDTAGGGVTGGRRFRVTLPTHSLAQSYHYRFRAIDRDGLVSDFTAAFQLDATLRVDNVAIHDGDDISPVANLSALLVCPVPLDPQSDIALTVNGIIQPFQADSSTGDHSGREWILRWTHPEFAKDNYVVKFIVKGNATIVRTFKVTLATGDLKISNLIAFPNPFDNDGTNFSFQLLGSDPADVRVSVFTISGRRIYSNVTRGLAPGYHQLPWDGRDAEGDALANGVYFYRLSATTGSGRHADQLGRLVKLRKPRHVDVTAP